MYSSFQRLNNIFSLATTVVMVLLAAISLTSFFTLPTVNDGRIDIQDVIVGRLKRWGAREEDLASLRFDIKTDLTPLLESYNTKQLFLYLTANYADDLTGEGHEVVLWDRIVTRGESRDIRAVGRKVATGGGKKKGRGKLRVEEGKNKYVWKNPSGSFKDIHQANVTLYYSLMPYVGIVSSGIAATAQGPITIPPVIKR